MTPAERTGRRRRPRALAGGRRQSGFTLIELMVGLVLGLIVTAALFWIYVANIRATSDSVKAARLNNDLRAAMELMAADIRRAGYWEDVVVSGSGVTNLYGDPSNPFGNPFTNPLTGMDITVGTKSGETWPDSCITYTYDSDRDGVPTLSSEGLGFRLNAGAVEMRKGGDSTLDCEGTSGVTSSAEWEPVTDPNFVTITGLTFRVDGAAGEPSSSCLNLSASCSGDGNAANSCGDDNAVNRCCWRTRCCDDSTLGYTLGYTPPNVGGGGVPPDRLVESRVVAITLTGQVADDPAVTKTLAEFVKVRNDRALLATWCPP